MLYLQLKERVVIEPGQALRVGDVADAMDGGAAAALETPIDFCRAKGVWRLPAITVVRAVLPQYPDVRVLGADTCYVHVVPKARRNRTQPLRTAVAFLLLMIGSALAITWFHADVNMLDAQQSLFRLFTGHRAENTWLITIPYAAGVFLGVSLFYALLGRKETVSPLEIKLSEYRQSAEEAAGKTP